MTDDTSLPFDMQAQTLVDAWARGMRDGGHTYTAEMLAQVKRTALTMVQRRFISDNVGRFGHGSV